MSRWEDPNRMAGHAADNVIDLAAARSARHATLLIRVGIRAAGEEAIRHIGVDSTLQLGEVRDIIATTFSLDVNAAPCGFVRPGTDTWLDPHHEIGELLRATGDHLQFRWGLWTFDVHLGDRWPRDAGTPEALCVGGVGDFNGVSFQLSEINRVLTDDGITQDVLATLNPAVRDVIRRSSIFDFIPLLHAMDLRRPVQIEEAAQDVVRGLPVEDGDEEQDAFWATVLGLSCLATDDLTDSVIEDTMSALDWASRSGQEYTADQVRGLCSASLGQLASIGGYGPDAAAPVERLDIYRELLRNQNS